MTIVYSFCRDGTTPKKSSKINFNPPELQEPATLIEFHVLLSKEEWLWDDTAKVYIRFGDYRLGGFDCCHGPMDINEYVYILLLLCNVCILPLHL